VHPHLRWGKPWRWTNWVGLAVGGYSLAYVSFCLLQPWGPAARAIGADAGGLLGCGGGAVITLIAGLRVKDRERRRAWLHIAAALLSYTLGYIIWSYRNVTLGATPPAPDYSDFFQLLTYPLLIRGILLFPHPPLKGWARIKLYLDASIIVAAMALFSWLYVMSAVIASLQGSLMGLAFTMAYPIGDLAVGWCLLSVYFANPRGILRRPLAILLFSVLCLAVFDTLYVFLNAHHWYHPGLMPDGLGLLGAVLTGVAALAEVHAERGAPLASAPPAQPASTRASQTFLPYVGLVAVFAQLLSDAFTCVPTLSQWGTAVGAALVLGAIVARQIVTIVEAARLNQRLLASIAELERAETALRHSEQKFSLLVERSPDGILLTDEAGRIIACNPGRERLTGRPASAVLGSYLWDEMYAVTPESSRTPEIYERLRGMGAHLLDQDDGEPNLVFEHEATGADGLHRLLQSLFFTIPAAGGRMLGAIIRDLTERQRAEQQIKTTLAREQELSQMKTHFISTASHEFRTPLATMLSSAELIERYGERWDAAKRARHLRMIQNSAKHMNQMLDDVLAIGRAQAGRDGLRPAPLDLDQFCQDVVDQLQRTAHDGQLIRYRSTGLDEPIALDATHMRHILTNLLSNALKYSPGGQDVQFSVERADGHVTFVVADQGIGIPEADQARLFEVFQRASNVGTIPGTGLGLAIVKRSLELHGGTIEFDSAPGAGTTFRVTLPVRRIEEVMGDEQNPGG
jgi:PAS domain S-box-containing protein